MSSAEARYVSCFFTIDPKVEDARDQSDLLKQKFNRVCTGFSFSFVDKNERKSISVHRGFLTNGYSLPRLVRSMLKKWIGLDHPAIILHDWLCEYLLVEREFRCIPITKSEAIEIFYKALTLTNLTHLQLDLVREAYLLSNLFIGWTKNKPTISPYKRYLEDGSYSTTN